MVAARRKADVPVSLNQLSVDQSEFQALHKQILSTPAAERVRWEGLDTRRVDLIPAGSIFLATVMELFGFDAMTVSKWSLREGIVLEAIRRHDPADWSDDPRAIRRASVQGLARRCNWHEGHSRHVAKLALELFDQTQELHGLDPGDRELLEYAALLHDIGEHVATTGHHKHGAYIIRNGRLRGFAPDDVLLLSAITRWHRRGEPKANDEFAGVDEERLRRLVTLLRMADGLDRGRTQPVDGVDVRVGPSLVVVGLRANANVELELWGARRKRDLFEKVFARDLELVAPPSVA